MDTYHVVGVLTIHVLWVARVDDRGLGVHAVRLTHRLHATFDPGDSLPREELRLIVGPSPEHLFDGSFGARVDNRVCIQEQVDNDPFKEIQVGSSNKLDNRVDQVKHGELLVRGCLSIVHDSGE